MSYPRVNLLKKNEQRYQGAVSYRFIFACASLGPIALLVLLCLIMFIQKGAVSASLKSTTARWEEMQPDYKACIKRQQQLKTNQQVLALLKEWKASKLYMSVLLDDVQKVVPENIQLLRLSLRTPVKSSVYTSKKEILGDYKLVIQGVSQGAFAEDSVIALRKGLVEAQSLAETFNSVKLASMRKRTATDGESLREFSLEGTSEKGGAR